MLIVHAIKREMKIIQSLISSVKLKLSKIGNLPELPLICDFKSPTRIYYYTQKMVNGKRIRNYLGTVESEIVKQFKKRRFFRDMLNALEFDYVLLSGTLEKFRDYSPAAIHRQLPSSYKNLPDECYVDDRFEELKEWAAEEYKRNPYPLPTDPNVARDGTPMRSKGECMWYDNILFEKIPVRIEPELILTGKSGKTYKFYPDFVFMCYDGSLIIVEHFGKLDDENYAATNLPKIKDYHDCGYTLGDNLIITSDNINHRTNEIMIVNALEMIKKRIAM